MNGRLRALARVRAREERSSIALSVTMHRSMPIAGATAWVSVTSLDEELEPRFAVTWRPVCPSRFSSADMALFDAFRRQAMQDLRDELAASR